MSRPTAVSVFSGLGGLDYGVRLAGADVMLATDADSSALSLLADAQGTETLQGDLPSLISAGDFQAAVPESPTLLVGGPPCTAFSHAGFWLDNKREGRDPAAGLLGSFVEALRELRPAAFIMENVPGLRFKTHRNRLDSLINRARAAGYSVSHDVLNAAEFGVPQARRRLFVVGIRGGPQFPFEFTKRNHPRRSTGWAFDALKDEDNPAEFDERPDGIHSKWLLEVPPGENYIHLTDRGEHRESPFEYRSRYWSFLLKLHPDDVSPTIPAQRVTYNGPFHWSNRHLRVREMARLQMFPDSQPLSQDVNLARRHIGNAVPPILAAWLTHAVLVHMGSVPRGQIPDALTSSAMEEASFADVTAAYQG